jgi:AcrR family transcriptional regulator
MMRKNINRFLEKRKYDIFTAALKLADRFGLKGITTKKLAEEIGFGEGALYKHIKSKSEIFAMILDISEKLLEDEFKRIKKRKLKPEESLKEWFKFAVDYLNDFPGIYRILFTDELYVENEVLFVKFKKIIEELRDEFSVIIRKGISKGEFRDDIVPEITAIRYLGIIHTAFTWWNVFIRRKSSFGEVSLPILDEFFMTIKKRGDKI